MFEGNEKVESLIKGIKNVTKKLETLGMKNTKTEVKKFYEWVQQENGADTGKNQLT